MCCGRRAPLPLAVDFPGSGDRPRTQRTQQARQTPYGCVHRTPPPPARGGEVQVWTSRLHASSAPTPHSVFPARQRRLGTDGNTPARPSPHASTQVPIRLHAAPKRPPPPPLPTHYRAAAASLAKCRTSRSWSLHTSSSACLPGASVSTGEGRQGGHSHALQLPRLGLRAHVGGRVSKGLARRDANVGHGVGRRLRAHVHDGRR